ncbi:MAG: VOC family protein [Pseudomonadales bacterium]
MAEHVPRFVWGHININVSNLERSIEFYQKLGFEMFIPAIAYLGLTMDPGPAALSGPSARALGLRAGTRARACIMQLDGGFPKIDLTELAGAAGQSPLTSADVGLVRLCLATSNLRKDYERLIAQGVPFLTPPQTGYDGLADIAVCADPDGTLIELLQVYLEKWPNVASGD